MKIKNKDILEFASLKLGDKHLPVKVAFAISVNAEAANGALKAFNEQRTTMIEKYAKKNEKGEPMIAKNGMYESDKKEEWNEEYEELLNAEAEIAVSTIKMKDLLKCDESGFDSLSLSEIALLRFMIEA